MHFTRTGNFKTRYVDEMTLFVTDTGRLFVLGVAAALLAFALWSGPYPRFLLQTVAIFTIGAVGLNLLTGNTGQISLGHGAFMGVGAYAAGLLAGRGLPFGLAVPLAGLVGAAAGVVFGAPSLRVKGLYLALSTLAAQVVLGFVFNWYDSRGGGTSYLVLPAPALGPWEGRGPGFAAVLVLMAAGSVWTALNLLRTRFGRDWVAIRDNDRAAAAMGVPVFPYKLLAFAVSAFYAGVAGALWAYLAGVVSAERFTLLLSVEYLAMIIVGGLGSVLGSVLGAAFLTLLPEGLRLLADALAAALPGASNLFVGLRYTVFGAAIVGFLVFEPEGLADRWRVVKAYFDHWPFRY